MTDKAKTYDDGKAPLAAMPWKALKEMSLVQLYGEQKYGDFDNYRKGMEVRRNLSCAIRHIVEYLSGVDLDRESGRHHLGHALARVAFTLENIVDGVAIDDRYTSRIGQDEARREVPLMYLKVDPQADPNAWRPKLGSTPPCECGTVNCACI